MRTVVAKLLGVFLSFNQELILYLIQNGPKCTDPTGSSSRLLVGESDFCGRADLLLKIKFYVLYKTSYVVVLFIHSS